MDLTDQLRHKKTIDVSEDVWFRIDESLENGDLPAEEVDKWIEKEYGLIFEDVYSGANTGQNYYSFRVTDVDKLVMFMLKWGL